LRDPTWYHALLQCLLLRAACLPYQLLLLLLLLLLLPLSGLPVVLHQVQARSLY
jgi:hypothetical protein